MISKHKFVEEFTELAAEAGIDCECVVDFPEFMSRRHYRDRRSYAQVDPHAHCFDFAVEVLELPPNHRRGLIMHEIGHCLDPDGSEDDADQAAERVFGERIEYDSRWPGKGLQCVQRRNPAYELSAHADPGANEWTIDAYELPSWERVGRAEFVGEHKRTPDEDAWGGYREELVALKGWNVEVSPEHRRKGLARSMYARAEQEWGLPIIPGDFQTEQGEAFLSKKNPPYSGYDKTYFRKPLPPDPTKISYSRKRDALNVFIDWNRRLIDDYGGASMKHSPESFEAINHKFDIKGKRRVDTIAKALWWALPSGSPYYLEDIDVELLNRTAPAIYNTERLVFSLPDYAEERRLLEQEAEHWERYADVEYPEYDDPEVPF